VSERLIENDRKCGTGFQPVRTGWKPVAQKHRLKTGATQDTGWELVIHGTPAGNKCHTGHRLETGGTKLGTQAQSRDLEGAVKPNALTTG
jgi:hypothetical protein